MSRITAVANVKGGVGKTTVVVNLGLILAQQGYRVLLVDTDVQNAVADWLGVTPTRTLADLLADRVTPAELVNPVCPKLDLVASGHVALRPAIARLLGFVSARKRNPIFRRMDRLFADLDRAYDVMLVDCAPSLDVLMEAVYPSLDDVLVPTTMTTASIKNMELQLDTIEEIRRHGYGLSLCAIVPTMWRADDARHRAWLNHIETSYAPLVAAPIHFDTRLEVRGAQREAVIDGLPASTVARDFRALAERYLQT